MLEAIKKRFFDIRPGEWPRALALSAFFFLVIAIFWVLKPIKKGVLIAFYKEDALALMGMTFGGAEVEQLAKVLNMIVIYGVVVLFTLMVRHFERQQVVYLFCGALSVLMAIFAVAVVNPNPAAAWSLYIFGDVFNSIMVATFWAFTNDINTPDQSKRLYGMIGLGGVLGGFVGATFVGVLADVEDARELLDTADPATFVKSMQKEVLEVLYPAYELLMEGARGLSVLVGRTGIETAALGRSGLILGCIIGMVLIAVIAGYVNWRAGGADGPAAGDDSDEKSTMSAALEGARLVFRSKYLLAILGIIGLYEVTSNIIEFQLSATVETSALAGTEIDAFFGQYGLLISLVSIAVQLLLTPYLMNRWSVGVALMVLPVVDLILSAGFLAVPVLGMAAALSIGDNALNYSINQSAKESLYTPTTPDEKYKAKAFIDMFIQRGAKVLAVGLNLTFAALVSIAAVRWLSLASFVVLAAWIAVVIFAGRRFSEKAGDARAEGEREEEAA
jgi:AAA family ATP:ADP antiporter